MTEQIDKSDFRKQCRAEYFKSLDPQTQVEMYMWTVGYTDARFESLIRKLYHVESNIKMEIIMRQSLEKVNEELRNEIQELKAKLPD